MKILTAILLALVLAADSFRISASCSAYKKMPYAHGLLLTLTFSAFHTIFLLLGSLLGTLIRSDEPKYNVSIGAVMISMIGIKMIVGVIRKSKNAPQLYVTDAKSILLLSIATSLDILIVGLGLGFDIGGSGLWWCAGFMAFFTVVSTFLGVLMGRQSPKRRSWITIVAGIGLLVFAARILIRVLTA